MVGEEGRQTKEAFAYAYKEEEEAEEKALREAKRELVVVEGRSPVVPNGGKAHRRRKLVR